MVQKKNATVKSKTRGGGIKKLFVCFMDVAFLEANTWLSKRADRKGESTGRGNSAVSVASTAPYTSVDTTMTIVFKTALNSKPNMHFFFVIATKPCLLQIIHRAPIF